MTFLLILLGSCYLIGIVVMALGLIIPPEYYEDASGIHYYPRKGAARSSSARPVQNPRFTAA